MKSVKIKILMVFLVYGVAVGLLSIWWWGISDNVFFPNVPGMLLGDLVYNLSIKYVGNPTSPHPHYTIPWILRIPQVYFPVSILFWGIIGILIRWALGRFRRSIDTKPM